MVDIGDAKIFSPAANFQSVSALVNVFIKNATAIAAVVAFVLIVLGGFGIIAGAGEGDSKKLEQGKQAITGAIIGFVIVVTAVWLVEIIGKITGLQILNPKTF